MPETMLAIAERDTHHQDQQGGGTGTTPMRIEIQDSKVRGRHRPRSWSLLKASTGEWDYPPVPRRSSLSSRRRSESTQIRTPRDDWGDRHAVPAEPRREDWRDFAWHQGQAAFQGRDPRQREQSRHGRRAEQTKNSSRRRRRDLNRGVHYG